MQQTLSYHNTTSLSGAPLEDSIKKAKNQNVVILEIFKQARTALGPWDVLKYCDLKGYNYPITSVRRAINTLTNNGELIKTELQHNGNYNKPEGLWVYWDN